MRAIIGMMQGTIDEEQWAPVAMVRLKAEGEDEQAGQDLARCSASLVAFGQGTPFAALASTSWRELYVSGEVGELGAALQSVATYLRKRGYRVRWLEGGSGP